MRICWPHNNLGCLGIKTTRWYIDFFRRPYWGMFVAYNTTHYPYTNWFKRWYVLFPYPRKVKEERDAS